MADQVGRVLGGRYRLVAPIGMGASAHVYVADDAKLRRRVAVKVLHAALAADESFLRRFRAEAHAAAALRHPHIMSVYDWGEDEDGPFLVLEHLGGGSLRDMLDAGHLLSPAQAARVGAEAAWALEYAHRRGLVHRDIKPANLLFDDEGRLCIADFGLARALAEAAWTEPAGLVLGTARYASPEQARGASVDPKADVYALALVLVESMTGTAPFSADTTIATLMARLDKALEPPAEAGPLAPVLAAAGTVDPGERVDAAGLARAIEETRRHLPPPAALPLERDKTIDLTAASDPDPTELPAKRPVAPYDRAADPWYPDTDADRDATVALGSTGVGADDIDEYGGKRRRLRRVLLALFLVLLVGAGAAAAAYAFRQAAIPAHAVPRLRDLTLAQARSDVAEEEFLIRVAPERAYDENIPPGGIVNQDPREGTQLKEGRAVTVVLSKGAAPRQIPSLAAMTEEQAIAALNDAGLTPKIERTFNEEIAKGTVIGWRPEQGEQPKGAEITVVVSDGAEPRQIPDLAKRAWDEARQILEGMGLVPKRQDEFSDKVDEGQVVSTQPPAGERADKGSEVTVVVSKGPKNIQVPDVSGLSVDEAEEALNSVGLRVSGVQGSTRRSVKRTDPKAGATVREGTGITLVTE